MTGADLLLLVWLCAACVALGYAIARAVDDWRDDHKRDVR